MVVILVLYLFLWLETGDHSEIETIRCPYSPKFDVYDLFVINISVCFPLVHEHVPVIRGRRRSIVYTPDKVKNILFMLVYDSNDFLLCFWSDGVSRTQRSFFSGFVLYCEATFIVLMPLTDKNLWERINPLFRVNQQLDVIMNVITVDSHASYRRVQEPMIGQYLLYAPPFQTGKALEISLRNIKTSEQITSIFYCTQYQIDCSQITLSADNTFRLKNTVNVSYHRSQITVTGSEDEVEGLAFGVTVDNAVNVMAQPVEPDFLIQLLGIFGDFFKIWVSPEVTEYTVNMLEEKSSLKQVIHCNSEIQRCVNTDKNTIQSVNFTGFTIKKSVPEKLELLFKVKTNVIKYSYVTDLLIMLDTQLLQEFSLNLNKRLAAVLMGNNLTQEDSRQPLTPEEEKLLLSVQRNKPGEKIAPIPVIPVSRKRIETESSTSTSAPTSTPTPTSTSTPTSIRSSSTPGAGVSTITSHSPRSTKHKITVTQLWTTMDAAATERPQSKRTVLVMVLLIVIILVCLVATLTYTNRKKFASLFLNTKKYDLDKAQNKSFVH